MNKEQLLKLLGDLYDGRDTGNPESDHPKADMALLEYINDPEITEAFKKVERWYA